MKEHTREEPKILAAAERQMQAWELTQEMAERTRPVWDRPKTGKLGDFITISREVGTGGGLIAEMVGMELGWEVLDKNLLDQVADRSKLPRRLIELVDEMGTNWADDILDMLLDPQSVPPQKYLAYLGRIVLAAARRGDVVLVGRGARFLLPREQGLAVRIIAPRQYRQNQIMRRHGLSATRARRLMADVDRKRSEFVERFFHRDVSDSHLYDLVINVERLGPKAAAEVIVEAYPS